MAWKQETSLEALAMMGTESGQDTEDSVLERKRGHVVMAEIQAGDGGTP